jgi:nicotinamide-nucleotide amidase
VLIIELITTGSELMLGFVLNTHQQWISRQLADVGLVLTRHVTVADGGDAIREVAREALGRADIIITTGGLGPTSDDRTRDLIAELLETKLSVDADVLKHIESFFASRKRPMPPSTAVQALVPEGATVLANAHGTAPGLALEIKSDSLRRGLPPALLIMLPGPPRELRPMFSNQVLPLLRERIDTGECFACHTLKTTGLGESVVEERIAPALQDLVNAGLEIGYCARVGEVEVRLVSRMPNGAELLTRAEQLIREQIGQHVFGVENEQLEDVLIRTLKEKRWTLALAESCTGGFISNRLTNVPGASAVFLSGLVTYSNEAKQQFLGVRSETLEEHGAVSEPVAREMAEGLRARTGASFGIAVTGIAGPSGGTADKPVGTVFIALAREGETTVLRRLNPYDRETFKYTSSQQALDLLRRTIAG